MRRFIEYLAAQTVLQSLAVAPNADRLARSYVGLLDKALPRLRRVALRNLELALPELDPNRRLEIVNGSFDSIARILVALSRFRQLNKKNIHNWIRYDGFEHFQTAKARGKGVLFATAHLGNWELSAFAHALMAEPMHVVVRPLDNPAVDRVVEDLRTASGNCVIGKRDFARSIFRALSRNEAVGILIDQNVGLDEGIFVDFFGRPACVSPTFAKLAARTGAAIIPGYAVWSPAENRYILKFHPPLYATGDVHADTQRIHTQLESAIRAFPDQWLWMHRRWKTRPPGTPPLY